MEKIIEVARYFYSKNVSLTDKQVQKLVYYAYSWFIVQNNDNKDNIQNRLFDQHPEAWIHGPVFRDLFVQMNCNRQIFYENLNDIKLDENLKLFLDVIYNVYGKYNGNQLEELTHEEEPWKEARKGFLPNERCTTNISDKVIYQFYSK